MTPLIAITMGDAAGIGPEIIAASFRLQSALLHGCFVVGDVPTMRRAAQVVTPGHAVALPVAVIARAEEARSVPPGCIPVLPISPGLPTLPWGQVNALAGAFAGQCVVWAAQAALRGDIAAVVTAPLHKESLAAAGAPWNRYPGHTELLQATAAEYLGQSIERLPVRMMLANESLRTVLVSIHVALRQAIDAVTTDNVWQTIEITHVALKKILGRSPRIAVAGLNPHAGEGGLFGSEERQSIMPAIQRAQAQGYEVSGPWAPDTVFMRARHADNHVGEFDVVVAMYHDQGLIPVKYLGVDHGVNVTLGLPFVRTSPDHGTAFDIAGSGQADASSVIEAVRTAKAMLTS